MTVKYENDRVIHKSQRAGGRGNRVGVPKRCLVAPQRIAYTMAAGKRRKQTIFRPAASSKKYEKKIIKIRKIGESQGKRPRKDVKAPTVSFAQIK